MATREIGTSQLAAELHTSPQALRRFLRMYLPKNEQPGSARGRYCLDSRRAREVRRAWKLRHP